MENPDLREIALDYVEKYGGSFEPLVRAKVALTRGEDLNASQIRVILNCMRLDPNVSSSLPSPRFGIPSAKRPPSRDAIVIPLQRDKRTPEPTLGPCGKTEPHHRHPWGKPGESKYRRTCEGVIFPINRYGTIGTEAKVKYKFATSKGGKLVHKTTGEAVVIWHPHDHEWGFDERFTTLKLKLECKLPSWLTDPILYKEEPTHLYGDENFGRTRCSRCFTATELREGPVLTKGPLGLEDVIFLPPVCMIPDCGCDGYAHA